MWCDVWVWASALQLHTHTLTHSLTLTHIQSRSAVLAVMMKSKELETSRSILMLILWFSISCRAPSAPSCTQSTPQSCAIDSYTVATPFGGVECSEPCAFYEQTLARFPISSDYTICLYGSSIWSIFDLIRYSCYVLTSLHRPAPTTSSGALCQPCSLLALEPYTTRQQDPTPLRLASRGSQLRLLPTTAPLTVLQTAAVASKMTCFNNSASASIPMRNPKQYL